METPPRIIESEFRVSGRKPRYANHSTHRSMAKELPSTFDPDQLQRMIVTCRARLIEEPGDIGVRITLAWCLFFQALHYKHQQAFWQKLYAESEGLGDSFRESLKTLQAQMMKNAPDGHRLLKDSLMQAATVMQLSALPRERTVAAIIQELATLLGEEQAVAEVDIEAMMILNRVAKAIYSERGGKSRSSRDDSDI